MREQFVFQDKKNYKITMLPNIVIALEATHFWFQEFKQLWDHNN